MPKPGGSWLIVSLLGSLLLPSGVWAQSPDDTLTLELLRRIEQLEREVRHIRGELELYRHQVEGSPRTQAAPAPSPPAPPAPVVERPVEAPAAPVPPPPAAAPTTETETEAEPPVAVAPDAEQADFDAALNAWNEGRYPEVVTGFQRFLNAYPDSTLAGDAQYGLGEAYYAVRDYEAAKEAFINLGLRYPNSERLPDALLKLGYIYGDLGDTARAKGVLQKLIEVYPDSPAAQPAEERLQSLP